MTTLSLPSPRSRALALWNRIFHRNVPTVVLPGGRTIDRDTLYQIKDLSPHLLKDIGVTDF